MVKFRNMATAFLFNAGDVLLMKRAENRKMNPGVWAGVGGHLEAEEINDPRKACLREIFEETRIQEKDIEGLKLKYIVLSRGRDEIRVNHYYFGNSNTRDFTDTDEGKLYWISGQELMNREFNRSVEITLEHYLKYGNEIDDVLVGTVSYENDESKINWCLLQEWRV